MSDTPDTAAAPDETPSRSLTETVHSQAVARQKEIAKRIDTLQGQRDKVNAEIKGLRAEAEEVDRLVRATTPKSKG